MVEPPQRPSADAMGHHPRCLARSIFFPKGLLKKREKKKRVIYKISTVATVSVAYDAMDVLLDLVELYLDYRSRLSGN